MVSISAMAEMYWNGQIKHDNSYTGPKSQAGDMIMPSGTDPAIGDDLDERVMEKK